MFLRRLPPRHLLRTSLSPRQTPLRALATAASPTPANLKSAPSPVDAFANGTNSYYIEEMYRLYQRDPSAVHPSWKVYFSGMDTKGLKSEHAFVPPPQLMAGLGAMPVAADGAPVLSMGGGGDLEDHMKVQLLVRAYQVRGHHIATLDPLGINAVDLDSSVPSELQISTYGWEEKDLDKEFALGPGILPQFLESGITKMTLREVIETCKKVYCSSVGVQYVHIPDRLQCDWLRAKFETPVPYSYTIDEKRMILDRLIWSDSFEKFIASKYPNEKRFGLEGCESLIPGMKALIDRSVDEGVKSIVIGMPHRGRLNVLSNVIRKPTEAILNEFAGSKDPNEEGGGDVKYHLGANYVRPTPSGKRVYLSLVANPSHLEAEDPVVLGKTKGIQHFEGMGDTNSAMGVLLHGDAAFAGQGVVYETMGMYDLPNYGTGGTIHLIVNNQIGFTTDPREGRSTPYPSDIAKAIDAPIFHVNGDDVEAVNFVCQLAADWRAKFKKDVVIDIVCYRKHGHNETDQPSFTQPKMYQAIGKQKSALEQYAEKLVKEETFTKEEIEKHKQWVWGMLEKAQEASKDYKTTSREWLSSSWEGFPSPKELKENILEARKTGVEVDRLKSIGEQLGNFPDTFSVHRNLARILATRAKTVKEGVNIDYSTAEALAFGTLALEGNHVRLSGQDVERGTFSQRHAVLHDQETDERYTPLNHLSEDQAKLTICNSPLSEFGVLGFELGYSLVDPHSLTIWEAQFGDFANGAAVIVDQFISSGERKWLQRSGLVMSLPHGYDGQGPEHSSARLERFLQLCDDHPLRFPRGDKLKRQLQDCNMQVVYPTTPSNCFHVLRRQVHRDFRKPLILLFSKNLLRHPMARSTIEEMGAGTAFQRFIPDPHPESLAPPEEIKRHIICSGQVYYQLLQERENRGINNIAISRLEQISPVPYDLIVPALNKYPNSDVMWAQEEPLNGGAWSYLQSRIETAMRETDHHKEQRVWFAGRDPTSSVATGSKAAHKAEMAAYLNAALTLRE
ncbi:2-oxoglutarate dehydrogenase complex E1 component mitochondrial precursor [Atractiella rhizophila]|nr:2-oxoglutarate dehydrogenase complex E1 component mitochondrial precursor [Atractiella rhizophila]